WAALLDAPLLGRHGLGRGRLLVPAKPDPGWQPASLDPSPGPDRPAVARTGPRRPRSSQRPQLPDRRQGLVGLVPPRPPRRPLDHLARPGPRGPYRPRPGRHLALVARKALYISAFRPIDVGGPGRRGARGTCGGAVVAHLADLGLGTGGHAAWV